MLTAVLIGFLLALPAPWLLRSRPVAAGWLFALVPLALTLYFASRLAAVAAGGAVVERYPWVPALGVDLTFYADGLALLFALLIAGFGALILIYSGRYLAHEARVGHFFRLLLFFMASMLGLVLAGNLITLFVFWELTSISSFFLIGYHHREAEARAAARQALLVTAVGEQALLVGLLLLGQVAGSLEMADLLGRGETIRESGLYLPILLLVLAGAFSKSAQMPLHFWLPSAMTAPTPVSAYLHSVTMVKAGVYLLARLSPVLGGSDAWQLLLTAVGGATMVLGALMALGQNDFKRLLAYSTINALGTLVFLLGIDTALAIRAALVFLLVHALYKGALFLVAGIVDHEAGTRDLRQLHGLCRKMPLVAAAAVLAALSLAGFPPLFGFIGKETIYHAVLNAPIATIALTALAVAANVVLVVLAGIITLKPFFGRPPAQGSWHFSAPSLSLGPLLLAGAGLLFGLFPGLIDQHLLAPATAAVLGRASDSELELWHGVNPRLLLSVLTLALGLALFAARQRLARLATALARLSPWGPAQWYAWALAGLARLAHGQTRLLQKGSLQSYLLIILVATFALVAFALGIDAAIALPARQLPLAVDDVAIAVLVLASAALAIRASTRLEAIIAMGAVGFGIALLYARFSAPDLAMTQFAVETVTVILFVLVLHHFPIYQGPPERWVRGRDALVAGAAGVLITILVAAALAGGSSRLAPFFAAKTQSEAHGRNLVNVILVDFRSFDTVGEVAVLGLAAIGVFALLKPHAGDRPEIGSLIVATATRYLVPLLLVFSGFLLLRGHVLPGGGFIAGLLFAAAYAFHGFISEAERVHRELPGTPLLFIGGGLLLILASGVIAMLRGKAFLTGFWSDAAIPAPWELKLGTPVLFDLGICLAVAGAALAILLTLWEAE